MVEYEIQLVPIGPYSDEGEGCACVVVEHDSGKAVPCPNCGTKQTSIRRLHMSAFGAKADIPDRLADVGQ